MTNAGVLAEDIIERARQLLEKYYQQAIRGYDILFSYGIVEFDPDKRDSIEALLADGRADVSAQQRRA